MVLMQKHAVLLMRRIGLRRSRSAESRSSILTVRLGQLVAVMLVRQLLLFHEFISIQMKNLLRCLSAKALLLRLLPHRI